MEGAKPLPHCSPRPRAFRIVIPATPQGFAIISWLT